jgi:hypothetical protein
MKWPSVRVSMKTKKKQFHLNGCSHYPCSDTYNLWSWRLFRARRRQNQMKISSSLPTTNIVECVSTEGGKNSRCEIILTVGTLRLLLASVSDIWTKMKLFKIYTHILVYIFPYNICFIPYYLASTFHDVHHCFIAWLNQIILEVSVSWNWLISWNWVLFQKPPVAQQLKNFPTCSKKSFTGVYKTPDPSSPYHLILPL